MTHPHSGTYVVRALGAALFGLLLLQPLACSPDKDNNEDESENSRPIHTLSFNGEGTDLAADGNLLTLSARNKGIYVYDTSTAARPLEIAAPDLPYVYRTIVQNKTIFAFDEVQGLSFVNLSNINQLQLTQALSTSEIYGYVNDAAWVNDTLFFASESIGLSEYAVSDEFSLTGGKIASTTVGQPARSIAVTTDRLIAASFRGEINVYDRSASTGNGLASLNSIITGHRISGIACSDSFCYTAALSDGLKVYGFAEAAKPELQFELTLDDVIDLVHIDEDLLYASYRGPKGKNGWYVFNLSNGARPKLVRKIATGTEIRDFIRIREVTYVLLAAGELQIYNRESLK